MNILLPLFALLVLFAPQASAGTAQSSTITGPSSLTLREPAACAGAGQKIGGHAPAGQCCPGLVPLNTSFHGGYSGNCAMPALQPGHICAPCGNGRCDAATGENICNCPRDCDPAL